MLCSIDSPGDSPGFISGTSARSHPSPNKLTGRLPLTVKSTDKARIQKKLDDIIKARLQAAVPKSEIVEEINKVKAYLQGIVSLDLDLSKDVFAAPINAYFGSCMFEGDTDFSGAKFSEEATFKDSTFLNAAIFNDAKFVGHAHFDDAIFLGFSAFHDVSFSDDAFFVDSVFKGDVHFSGSAFSKQAIFYRSKFSKEAIFNKSKFFREAIFISSEFSGLAYFSDTEFSGPISFSLALFKNTTYFFAITWPQSTADKSGVFAFTVFDGPTGFLGDVPSAFAAFHNAIFRKELFIDKTNAVKALDDIEKYGTQKLSRGGDGSAQDEFHKNETSSDDRGNIDKNWKRKYEKLANDAFKKELKAAEKYKDTKNSHKAKKQRELYLEQLESGCRVLKKEMENSSDKLRAQLFHRFEIRARQAQHNTTWLEKRVSGVYWLVSDYGTALTRPLIWLAAWCLLFSVIYFALFQTSLADMVTAPDKLAASTQLYARSVYDAASDAAAEVSVKSVSSLFSATFSPFLTKVTLDSICEAMSVSLSRVFPFGPAEEISNSFTRSIEARSGHGMALFFRVLGAFESVIALLLLFLFGLALRRRFQVG